MNRKLVICSALGLLLLGVSLAPAHPHFNKSVTAKLPAGADVTITYNTTPSNETHAANASVGTFVTPRRPKLKLSADITAGGVAIAAGEYTIGVIKNSDNDWTMALYPGDMPRGAAPDMSKVIKLTSTFSKAHGTAAHMLIDITPGSGKLEGKAVLTLHFGSLFLEGALS
jgi:hypothetical protein